MSNCLELPGGRVLPGEGLEHALKRKLSQELGLHIQVPLYFTSIARVNRHGAYVRVIFEVAYDQKHPLNLSSEHSEHLWINTEQLADDRFTTDSQEVISQYLGEGRVGVIEEKTTTITVFTDGGSRGNPGPSASAYVIYNKYNDILESGGSYIGITTNNQAEYTGVLIGLKAAQKHASQDEDVLFKIDSLMVVNQLNGLYKIKNRELWPLNQQIRELMQQFKSVHFDHIPRESNIAADQKVNEILDAYNSNKK